MLQILSGILIGGLIVYLLLYPKLKEKIKNDEINEARHRKLIDSNNALQREQEELQAKVESLNIQKEEIIKSTEIMQEQAEQNATIFYEQEMDKAKQKLGYEIEKLRAAAAQESQALEQSTTFAIEEARQKYEQTQSNFNSLLEQKQKDIDTIQNKLDELNKLYESSIAARVREKEIKEKQDFYCLKIDSNDLADIQVLEKIKPKLNKPRILSMLIWSTYYQKPMTTLCNNVLGTKEVCGIYKITNQITNECYVGQASSVSERFKSHAKCGLDIDRPQGNKLYNSMIEYGLQNFSWELLEECPKDKLDERERYYIDLYKSADYGMNILKGNGGNK